MIDGLIKQIKNYLVLDGLTLIKNVIDVVKFVIYGGLGAIALFSLQPVPYLLLSSIMSSQSAAYWLAWGISIFFGLLTLKCEINDVDTANDTDLGDRDEKNEPKFTSYFQSDRSFNLLSTLFPALNGTQVFLRSFNAVRLFSRVHLSRNIAFSLGFVVGVANFLMDAGSAVLNFYKYRFNRVLSDVDNVVCERDQKDGFRLKINTGEWGKLEDCSGQLKGEIEELKHRMHVGYSYEFWVKGQHLVCKNQAKISHSEINETDGAREANKKPSSTLYQFFLMFCVFSGAFLYAAGDFKIFSNLMAEAKSIVGLAPAVLSGILYTHVGVACLFQMSVWSFNFLYAAEKQNKKMPFMESFYTGINTRTVLLWLRQMILCAIDLCNVLITMQFGYGLSIYVAMTLATLVCKIISVDSQTSTNLKHRPNILMRAIEKFCNYLLKPEVFVSDLDTLRSGIISTAKAGIVKPFMRVFANGPSAACKQQ